MIFMNKKFHFLCFALLQSSIGFAQAGTVTQDGIISSPNISLGGKIFTGKGIVCGKNITITCDEFLFTGTIECDGQCMIRCKKAFNSSQFTKKGKGKITIIISSADFVQCTKAELLNYAYKILVQDTAKKSADAISEQIKLIRYYAASNNIAEAELFALVIDAIEKQMESVKNSPTESSKKIGGGIRAGQKDQFKEIDEQISYHTTYLNEKYDIRHEEKLVNCGMVSAVGIWACIEMYFKEFSEPRLKYPAISAVALCTAIFAALTVDSFLKFTNPAHKEKLEALIAQRTEMEMKQQQEQEKLKKSDADQAKTPKELTVSQMDVLQALQTYKDMIQQALNQPFIMPNEQIITL